LFCVDLISGSQLATQVPVQSAHTVLFFPVTSIARDDVMLSSSSYIRLIYDLKLRGFYIPRLNLR